MAANALDGAMSVKQCLISSSTVDLPRRQSTGGCLPFPPQPHTRSAQESRTWQEQASPVSTARAQKSQHCPENAARERSRVRNLRQAFHSLQAALPSVPPNTKLSKLDVLVLATNYIASLTETLGKEGVLSEHSLPSRPGGYLHPIKKWPMRSLLYSGSVGDLLSQDNTRSLTPTSDAEKE